jgi:hypothetical protein
MKSREQKKVIDGKVGVVASEMEAVGKHGRYRFSRRYVATFGSRAQVSKLAYAVTCAWGAQEAKGQVVVGDGADWIKTKADLHFPHATKILD